MFSFKLKYFSILDLPQCWWTINELETTSAQQHKSRWSKSCQ